jgi:hypothetical protein
MEQRSSLTGTWDHYPTDAELAALTVDPVTGLDQWDHSYEPIYWNTGTRITAICSCCEKDFIEGGFRGMAPQGREMFSLLVCPDHTLVRALVGAEEEEVVGSLD